ncbi:hypothetical protein ILUMI_25059 [Ignelater luminosus]|uniref:DDE-1 domain-containing protein n=1 Tax=Ignelater luminosus TaxID=2038154 RepID=A0A8K0C9A7_IGNLU|nr:hypothetical protein ILUMI_25059 [Ignelater luminosus]
MKGCIPQVADGNRIFNLDESGVTTAHKPRKILAGKVSAADTYLPPALVSPRKYFKAHMLTDAPAGSLGLANTSGWMTSDLFIQITQDLNEETNKTNFKCDFTDNTEKTDGKRSTDFVSPEAFRGFPKAEMKLIALLEGDSHCEKASEIDVVHILPYRDKVIDEEDFDDIIIEEKHLRKKLQAGTVRDNRIAKFSIEATKNLPKRERGFFVRAFDKTLEILVVLWNDNFVVTVMTNGCTIETLIQAKRFGRNEHKDILIPQPILISEYDKFMGGLHTLGDPKNDQSKGNARGYYPPDKRETGKATSTGSNLNKLISFISFRNVENFT